MRQYIKEINSENFIYPNNDLSEYDVDIIHEINNNMVSGSTTGITITASSSTGITLSYSYHWRSNGAEPFINNQDKLVLCSLHIMPAGKNYYKPWACEYATSSYLTGLTAYDSTTLISNITPARLGLTEFTNGSYYYEFRFIGRKSVYTVCGSFEISNIPVKSGITLNNVTALSGGYVTLSYSGQTDCSKVAAMMTRNPDYVWWVDSPGSQCTGDVTTNVGTATGILYFKVRLEKTTGEYEYSNVVSYDYDRLTITGTTFVSGSTVSLAFTGATDCDSITPQYSENQTVWSSNSPTTCSSPARATTGVASGEWYFRLKETLVGDLGTKYSNVVSYNFTIPDGPQ